jgi:peroxiredoxin Q/BCP
MRLVLLFLSLVFLGCGMGDRTPKEGEKAPDFALRSQDGNIVRLSNFRGERNVVLYFYPKDDTPGCTKEACSFRDDISRFRALGTEVLGVSVDDVDSHKEFGKKYSLNFTLLADPDKQVTETYGVKAWHGMAKRVTFVIDREGVIRKVFANVDVSRHSEDVLEVLQAMTGSKESR